MKKEKISEPQDTKIIEDTPAPAEAPVTEQKAVKMTKVGSMLKEMRLQKGLKLTDISKKLCIRKLYLDAIEDSNYKDLPALPYGIGFIRSYANFLGLNGENIVELYKEETNIPQTKDMHVLEPQPEATMPGIQYLLISLLAIAVIYVGWSLFNQNEELPAEEETVVNTNTDTDAGVVVVEEFNFEPSAETEAPIEANDERPTEKAEDAPLPVEETKSSQQPSSDDELPTKEESTTSVTIPEKGVFIEVLDETWVAVKDEIKLYISKVLQPGSTYKVPEGKGMILSVGKVDGVNVYVNGKLTKVVRPGKKTNIALDPFLDAAQ